MKNNQSFLTRIFSHNIVLLVLAFLLSFSIWIMINANGEIATTSVVKDVKVTIELPDTAEKAGLLAFYDTDQKFSVTIKGTRAAIANVDSSDIKITSSQVSKLTKPGLYTLELSGQPVSLTSSFSVESIEPPQIECYIDVEKQEEFTIENKITAEMKDKDNKDNLSVDYVLSPEKVSVSGPETEISKITAVTVEDTITGVDADYDKTLTESLHFHDERGAELTDLKLVKKDVEEIQVHVSVLPVKTLNLTVDPVNGPAKNRPEITITPQTIKVAGSTEDLDSIKSDTISIGSLDFSKLSNTVVNQQYTLKAPKGKLVSSEKTANVSLDLSSYSKEVITAKISSRIDATAYTTELASNTADITIIGPADKLESIGASNIAAIADFSGLLDNVTENVAQKTVPLKISLGEGYTDCWVYGTYTIQANVSKKN